MTANEILMQGEYEMHLVTTESETTEIQEVYRRSGQARSSRQKNFLRKTVPIRLNLFCKRQT